MRPPRHASWSDHYKRRPRSPEVVMPAPWVLAHYLAKAPARVQLPLTRVVLAGGKDSASAGMPRGAEGFEP